MKLYQKCLLFLLIIAIYSFLGKNKKKVTPSVKKSRRSNSFPLRKKTRVQPNRKRTIRKKARSQINVKNKIRNSYVKKLLDHGFHPKEFEDWFSDGEPMAIHYRRNGRLIRMFGKHPYGSGKKVNKIITITDEESTSQLLRKRNNAFLDHNDHPSNTPPTLLDELDPLGEKAYKMKSFSPGLRDDGKTKIASPSNFSFSLQGPDNTFDPIFSAEELKLLRERTISLGHGGEITIEVKGGFVANSPGPDFIIYENPMIGKRTYLEYGYVGVSETDTPKSYKWFSCDPKKGVDTSCAGAIPTENGGDRFDLSEVGMNKIRFIKIRDTGLNNNNQGENTEGFDLDSIDLINAFKHKEV